MPRVVWAGESKNGLGFEIGPTYNAAPTRSQWLIGGQSSCSIKYIRNSQKQQLVHFSQTTQRQEKDTGNCCVLVSRNSLLGHSVAHPPRRRSTTAIGVRSYTWSSRKVPCLFTTWSGRHRESRVAHRGRHIRDARAHPQKEDLLQSKIRFSCWYGCMYSLSKYRQIYSASQVVCQDT